MVPTPLSPTHPNFTFTQLVYALAVARAGHFGRAAEASGVTQPTLSMQLQKLEETLGVVLFDRTKKPVIPTEAGSEILAQIGVVLHEAGRVHELVHAARGEVKGSLRLGVIPTLSPYLLPRFVPEFYRDYPGVHVTIEDLRTDDIVARLQDNTLDAGLLATPLGRAGLVEEPLFYEPFLVYAGKDHPLAAMPEVAPEALRPGDLWLLSEGHCLREQTLNLCPRMKARPESPSVRFESGSLETIIRMVERGAGYTLLPALAGETVGKDGPGVLRRFRMPAPVREVSLVYSRTFVKKAILDALRAAVERAVPGHVRKGPEDARAVVSLRPRTSRVPPKAPTSRTTR
jgi:LysR family hydrogen peroxide-inducible transcriptional activator